MAKKRLGISLYPEFSTPEQDRAYLEKAAKLGFTQLFIAFLAVKDTAEETLEKYLPICEYAHSLGFEIEGDVNPLVFDRLGVNASIFHGPVDLEFFKRCGVDIMRLDFGMSAYEEAVLTQNPQGIKIAINGCDATDHVGLLLNNGALPDKLLGCHNYYPQRYTGIGLDIFQRSTSNWGLHGMRLQVFVSSQEPDAFGPWPITEGLPTLEMHRNLPISAQVRHFMMMPDVTDVYIGNAFASDVELEAMAAANTDCVTFNVEPVEGAPAEQVEHASLPKVRRGDGNADYMVRSLGIRTVESNVRHPPIAPFNTVPVKRGDVAICNNRYGQYEGEVHLAIADMENDGKCNVIGHIAPEEVFLLDFMRGSMPFKLDFSE